MDKVILTYLISTLISAVLTKPYKMQEDATQQSNESSNHHMVKRYVSPWMTGEDVGETGILSKMRTKRSISEDCEKLQLCKLHTRSQHSFLATYQLYFINKENARLWDHSAHSNEDCERKYSGCFDTYASRPVPERTSNRLYEQDTDGFDY